jgi:hypothetical protein
VFSLNRLSLSLPACSYAAVLTKLTLLCEVYAARNDERGLILKIKELDDTLIDLLLDAGKVVLEATNEQPCCCCGSGGADSFDICQSPMPDDLLEPGPPGAFRPYWTDFGPALAAVN